MIRRSLLLAATGLVASTMLAGAAEWLWTAALLAQQRLALGQPWLRMALILGAVALLTLGAALVFRSAGLQARFGSAQAQA